LLLITIGIAVYRVTVAVTEQAQTDLQNGLHEAATLVDQYSRRQFADFLIKSSLITTLPKLAAVAETEHAPTVKPIAEEYRRMAAADLFVVLGRKNMVLANVGRIQPDEPTIERMIVAGRTSKDGTSFHVVPGGLVHTVALPIGSGLRTLVVGYSFDRDF